MKNQVSWPILRYVVPPSGGTRPIIAVLVSLLLFTSTLPIDASSEPTLANQPLTEYRARRQRLAQQVTEGVIVIGGAFEQDFGEVGRFSSEQLLSVSDRSRDARFLPHHLSQGSRRHPRNALHSSAQPRLGAMDRSKNGTGCRSGSSFWL